MWSGLLALFPHRVERRLHGWCGGCGCGWVERFCCWFGRALTVGGGGLGMLLGPEKTPSCGGVCLWSAPVSGV